MPLVSSRFQYLFTVLVYQTDLRHYVGQKLVLFFRFLGNLGAYESDPQTVGKSILQLYTLLCQGLVPIFKS